MIAAARRRLAATLGLLALGACTPIDSRLLTLRAEARERSDMTLQVSVTLGNGGEVELQIDGRAIGRFASGRVHAVDLRQVAEGWRTLRAVGVGARPPEPAELRFEVFRGGPRLVAVRPPSGVVPALAPLEVELEFSEPLDPTSLELDRTYFQRASPGARRTAEVSLEPDGKTVRLRLPGGLAGFETVWAVHQARDVAGYPAEFHFDDPAPLWTGAGVALTFAGYRGPYARGVVSLTLQRDDQVGGERPLQVFAGDHLLATLEGFPWAPVTWDTTAVPDGDYPIRVVSPGADVQYPPLRLTVDNTPPRLTCRPQRSPAGFAESRECVEITSSEETVRYNVQLVPEGTVIPEQNWSSGPGMNLACPAASPPPPPYVEHLDLSLATDLAGNPAVAEGCTLTVPAWMAPWGEEAISIGAAPVRAESMVLAASGVNLFTPARRLVLAWVAAVPDAGAGRLMTSSKSPGFAWAAALTLSSAGAVASKPALGTSADPATPADLNARLAWVERSAGGPGQVRSALQTASGWTDDVAGPLNRDAAHDADEPAVATAFRTNPIPAVLWSEEDGAGGRALQGRFANGTGAGTAMILADGDARAIPGSTVSGPAMAWTNLGTFIAFSERAPGGPALLRRVARFEPRDIALNADASLWAVDASVAATTDSLVTWVEGGLVLARGATFLGGEVPVAVLNADPAHVARAPAAFHDDQRLGVAFVEETPEGDQIRVRLFEGGTWRLLAGSANAGVPGPVRELRVASGIPGAIVLGWIDADGQLRVRLGND